MEDFKYVPCISCGKIRKYRVVKKTGELRCFREKCAACSGRGRKYPTLNNFTRIDSEEKAYSFGFFWADGCINRYKTFTVRLQEKDKEILERFQSYFGGNISHNKFKRSDGREYYQYSWVMNDKNWIETLKNSGFRTSIDKIPLNLYRHFLRGLMDGDGHYKRNKKGEIIAASISSNYQDNFEHVMSFLPFAISKLECKNGNKYSCFRFKGGSKKMQYLIHYLYRDSTIYLSRKYYYTPLMFT